MNKRKLWCNMKRKRIEIEKETIYKMVHIYCKGQRHGEILCNNCEKLIDYTNQRLDQCIFGENKTFCSKCTVHCFKPDMKISIKEVMKYSGPRMILHNPLMTIKHFLQLNI